MPANIQNLLSCLEVMKRTYLTDPTKAVRGQGFINLLHDYCVDELISVGVPREKIFKEVTVFGSHKTKDVDVAVIDEVNGPFIIFGIRSQMSSVGKNILTYYEEIIGDCISLHDRFPMAVICYIYLLPTQPIKPGKGGETIDLARAEQLFRLITDRGDWRNTKDKYEHFAFLKVDFTQDPPALLDTIPQLKIEGFLTKSKTLITREISSSQYKSLKSKSHVKSKTAQQSVHLTCGILRHFRVFFSLRVFPAPKHCPRPPTRR